MSAHKDKIHPKGKGAPLMGSPSALINLLIKDADLRQWTTEHIDLAGPKHTRVLTALLLRRLYVLVRSIQKTTDSAFALQKGHVLTSKKEDKAVVLPIAMPIHIDRGMHIEDIIQAISKAPEHELLTYAIALQVIEWSIKATSKTETLLERQLVGDGS
jgi:hypothetical protein